MSADNWTVCPKCKDAKISAQAEAILKAGKAYGNVTAEIYIQMTKDANRPLEFENSLREDYEIGIDEFGTFSVGYAARCTECKFKFEFTRTEKAI